MGAGNLAHHHIWSGANGLAQITSILNFSGPNPDRNSPRSHARSPITPLPDLGQGTLRTDTRGYFLADARTRCTRVLAAGVQLDLARSSDTRS